jgi:hypothetical protein
MVDPLQLRKRRLTLLLWIVVIILYVYLSYDYIHVRTSDGQLGSYLDYVVQEAGNSNRPPKEVRDLILVKAEELSLPLRGDQIKISGERQNMQVSLSYDVDIQFPFLQRVIYHKIFDHQASYHQAR